MAGGYALMWSGGKDSALALRRAKARGVPVELLVNFHDAEAGRVRFHATTVAMLRVQAEAIGLELRAIGTAWTAMEARLGEELKRLRSQGFKGVVFGDIHLADVRAWYEQRVVAAGLEHVEPLWGEASSTLLDEYVRGGGRAAITCIDLDRLGQTWLGRIIDEKFVRDIVATGVDPCGENGEYHSFAFAGPEFRQPVVWSAGETRKDGRFVQLDVVQPDGNENFRSDVALSRLTDPRPTLENLARSTGLTYEDVVHHALVRYAGSGAEALLAAEPYAIRQLIAARKAGDWSRVGAIIDWLEAGLASENWR
jgi:diphthine-ammonia ligase